MLRAQNLTKSYGGQVLLDNVSFLMNKGERLGLVGRNGSGKTTVFRMILGEEEPDDGALVRPKGYTTGHLSQHLVFHEPTVLAEACTALPKSEDGIDLTYKAEAALMGLGFERTDFDRAPGEFSGGYQIRINLAKVLISEPNLLLLDEPTNYLDIVSVRWLKQYLRSWPGELVVISHDREFLGSVTTHTMLIHRQGLRRMPGHIEKVIEQIATEEEVHEKTRVNEGKKRKRDERFIERFRYKASKAKAVQSRIKALDRKGQTEALSNERTLEFRFRPEPFHAPNVLKAKGLSFHYPDGPTIVDNLTVDVSKGDRIAVIGKNGRGKTTLLNLLAGELTAQQGQVTLHPAVRQAYFGQTNIDRLDHKQTVEDEILSVHPDHNRSAARGICGLMMFEGDLAMKKVAVLSGGERSRVLLGKILVSPSNLLLLDEPTNHLDMESVESLLEAIEEFPGAVILVTHSEMILERIANRLIIFDRGKSTLFEGGYRDFLDRVGWEGDETAAPKKAKNKAVSRAGLESDATGSAAAAAPSAPAKPRIPQKERRRLRAAIVSERSKKTGDLKKRSERLEQKIVRLEQDIEDLNQEMIKLANGGSQARLADAGKEAKKKQSTVDKTFSELETLTDQIDRMNQEFESRLAELEN